ncbi:MAG: hypothetical protein K2H56_03615 [Malacoplasma sp.]|nr:hypothetical protein [Malacoplasma sp.]
MWKIKPKFFAFIFVSAAFVLSAPTTFLQSNTNSEKLLINNLDSSFYLSFLTDQENALKTKDMLEEFARKVNIVPFRNYDSINDVNLDVINENNVSNYFKNLPSSNNNITVNLKRIYLDKKELEEINLEYEFSNSNNDSIIVTYSFKQIAFVTSKKIIINFVVLPISLIFLTFILVLVVYFASKKAEKKKKYNYLRNMMKK